MCLCIGVWRILTKKCSIYLLCVWMGVCNFVPASLPLVLLLMLARSLPLYVPLQQLLLLRSPLLMRMLLLQLLQLPSPHSKPPTSINMFVYKWVCPFPLIRMSVHWPINPSISVCTICRSRPVWPVCFSRTRASSLLISRSLAIHLYAYIHKCLHVGEGEKERECVCVCIHARVCACAYIYIYILLPPKM